MNDGCLFPVGFCFNVADPNLTNCSDADDVTEVAHHRQAGQRRDRHRRRCHHRGAAAQRLDVRVQRRLCAAGDVTRRSGKKDGKATLKVKSRTGDGRTDTDVVKLVCKPAP